MPKIIQLSPHIANLIAAGEVVERPASVVKELLENAVDAGASVVTIELRDGGMTFIRVTDNGCGMSPEDARTAFARHATSKLRSADDLAAITTMGFRGEALAAIASVSRIDLMTKTAGSLYGTSLHLEAGAVTEESEAGCPEGTTIIIRDLFFNTPARMKFMKADTVEGSRALGAVQMQALAHPEVSFRCIRDGKQVLSTPGNGDLQAAVYCVYGKDFANMICVNSRWDNCSITGYVSKPTDARPSRALQTFFVNDRPVKSKLLTTALEEAYRNQLMTGKFPACVLHLKLPAGSLDVNVHPAKTEVKFLSEKVVFDCIHYGILAALNKTPDRPEVKFSSGNTPSQTASQPPQKATDARAVHTPKPDSTFRTMNPEEYKAFASALKDAPKPKPEAAIATVSKLEPKNPQVREHILTPSPAGICEIPKKEPVISSDDKEEGPVVKPSVPPVFTPKPEEPLFPKGTSQPEAPPHQEEPPQQEELEMPPEIPWRMVGELYNSYILVEQGDEAFLIDKHAAHERILFEKLKANQERISSQLLLTPIPVKLSAEASAELITNTSLLDELGFEIDEFGNNTVLLRQIPMDLLPEDAAQVVESLSADLLNGRRENRNTIRDELLHTVACKAAIKAGWTSSDEELLILVRQVMSREDLKYCPHGRPICITLSKKQLEKQFKRS